MTIIKNAVKLALLFTMCLFALLLTAPGLGLWWAVFQRLFGLGMKVGFGL
jgi:hypothetical protein